ncbi:uncharacterized protein LOC117142005 isoform X2 [Drosophila mauritiana]|uniref:Uncharacterized protein LOC117142005 isoform X2 n=1 Tax=Drosophila mauritiana TaxID=7226 RepID=A0A6P8KEM6_DROMA|nr:uncharacterized protein LOC117142005 isoform X2 [Drosophila mauritiana]
MSARVCLCIFANENLTVVRKQPFVARQLAEKRADLAQPIVFKQRVKQPNIEKKESQSETNRKSEKSSTSKSKKSKAASSKLSFNEDEEDETPED